VRRSVPRTCSLCGANCGLVFDIDVERQQITSFRGDKDDPFSKGFVCPKAVGIKALREDPDVLRRPLMRRGNDFEEVDWDTALDFAAERLLAVKRRHGANAIGTYTGNATGHNIGLLLYGGLLAQTLGTNQNYSAGSVDHIPRLVSVGLMFGSQAAWSVPDIDRTAYFLMIGANPVVSGGNLMTAPGMPERLRAIRRRGGKVVLLDPRRNETAKLSDQHIPIRPGTDALFLLALIECLFGEGLVSGGDVGLLIRDGDLVRMRQIADRFPAERVAGATGVPAATIRAIARDMAAAPSASVYGRTGATLQRFGSLTSWLIDVVNILTGNMDRIGGVMFPDPVIPSSLFMGSYVGDQPPHGRWRSRVRGLPEVSGQFPVVTLADEIMTPGEGQIRAMISSAGNPLLSNPNSARLASAFAQLDFMMSIDIYLNETTRHADVILPTAGHSEHSHYTLYSSFYQVRHYARWSPALFPPGDGMRHEHEVITELVARLKGCTAADVQEQHVRSMIRRVLNTISDLQGLDQEAVRQMLGDEPGPDRLVDLLIRSGPHGDGFGRRPGGISLRTVKEAPHGLDLGPLRPEKMAEMLRTPDRRIHLVPDALAADLPRLEAELESSSRPSEYLLISRRHVRSNLSWMHNLQPLVKGPNRCTLYVNPTDAKTIGLSEGAAARLRSRVGEIVVQVEITDEVMPGVVCMPFGWGHDQPQTRSKVARAHAGVNSNLLADERVYDIPSANGVLNGISVTVEPA
jgi:anaerobic selenocysteine-containing dehydrogenase